MKFYKYLIRKTSKLRISCLRSAISGDVLLGLTLMEEAYQLALAGQRLPSLQNTTEARKIFFKLRSYPDQPQRSKERAEKLITYCDNLIQVLQNH